MTEHDLKCAPEYFEAVLSGVKTAELRKDDRGFQVGDVLRLREYDNNKAIQLFADADVELGIDEAWAYARPLSYTGREARRTVTHIVRGEPGLASGYVMLSLNVAAVEREACVDIISALGREISEMARSHSNELRYAFDHFFVGIALRVLHRDEDWDDLTARLQAVVERTKP